MEDAGQFVWNIQIITGMNLSDSEWNSTFGTSVTLIDSLEIENSQQLSVSASEVIYLKPGFSSFMGSNFRGWINNLVCEGEGLMLDPDSFDISNALEMYEEPELASLPPTYKTLEIQQNLKGLTISVGKNPVLLEIFDAKGALVYIDSQYVSSKSIPLDDWNSGLYIICVESEGQTFTSKISID